MGRMEGKNVIVTGAGRGIGMAIADALLKEGANLCYGDLNPDVADVARGAADRTEGASGKAIGVTVDVTKRDQVKAMIDEVVGTFGSLDVKFNNAGVNKPMNFLDVTEENWDFVMRINGLGVLIGSQEAAKQMIAQGHGGKIVNTCSIASRQGFDNVAPYCASKFAVLSLTQSAARDLARHKITVNGFAPGVVNTELWRQLDQDLMEIGASEKPGQAMEEFSSGILMGRPATPDDIVGTATFLACTDSDYMTGQCMMIDGGMILV